MSLKKCWYCKKESNQSGDRCQYCGENVFPVLATTKKAVAYLHKDCSFGELICDYVGEELTIEQLEAIFNYVYEVKLTFVFDGNKITSVSVD